MCGFQNADVSAGAPAAQGAAMGGQALLANEEDAAELEPGAPAAGAEPAQVWGFNLTKLRRCANLSVKYIALHCSLPSTKAFGILQWPLLNIVQTPDLEGRL